MSNELYTKNIINGYFSIMRHCLDIMNSATLQIKEIANEYKEKRMSFFFTLIQIIKVDKEFKNASKLYKRSEKSIKRLIK